MARMRTGGGPATSGPAVGAFGSSDHMTHRRRIDSRSEEGQTAVEFALIAPLLIVLLLGILQTGITFNHYLPVTDAARAGARRAIVARVAGLTPADVEASVRAAAPDLDQLKLKVKVDDPTWKAGSDVTVKVTYPYSIDILGVVVASGDLTSTMTDMLE
jgi:Flp pilus assembly protein TadG